MRVLTRDLPGTGGLHKASPEDFIVDELPAYSPAGEGPHTFVRIEKRALTTAEAVARLCRALAISPKDAGVAGQKDRQALTRQWVSLPEVDPERALAAVVDGVKVLEAARHGNKLRTGHLAGNRFTLTLRGVGADAVARAQAVLDRLAAVGLPNYFGTQRFGARGDNAARGKLLLAPPTGAADAKRRPRLPGAEIRMLVSAYQSELFNRYLDARIDDDLLGTVVAGDVLKKTDTGGLFTADEVAVADAQARLTARALVVTGPMFGHKMMSPPPGSPSRAREDSLLAAEGIDAATFAVMGKLAEGTRRPLLVPVAAPAVRPAGDDAIVLEFALPSGSYATVLLAEVVK
ncbi:MAG: tRNA pseudouridine synthase TruD [Myxococcales bacterium]|nr:tRNA pseudouridine synthase TruD [Myxococcales bacterium]